MNKRWKYDWIELQLWHRNKRLLILSSILLLVFAYIFYGSYMSTSYDAGYMPPPSNIAEENIQETVQMSPDETITASTYYEIQALHPNNALQYILATLSGAGPVIIGIFACMMISTDHKSRTLHLKYAHFTKKTVIYSKLKILFLVIILSIPLSMLAGVIFSNAIWFSIKSNEVFIPYITPLPFLFNGYMLLTPLVGILFYSLLGFTLTLFTDSFFLGIVAGYGFRIIENALSVTIGPANMYDNMRKLSFTYYPDMSMMQPFVRGSFSYVFSLCFFLAGIIILLVLIHLHIKYSKNLKY